MAKWNWEQGFKKGFGSISDFLDRYVDYAIRDSFQKKQEERDEERRRKLLEEQSEQRLRNTIATNMYNDWVKNNIELYENADVADENTAGNATVNVMGRTQRVPTAAPKNSDEKIDYVTYGDIVKQLRGNDFKISKAITH